MARVLRWPRLFALKMAVTSTSAITWAAVFYHRCKTLAYFFYFFLSSLWLSTVAPQPRKMASRVGFFLLLGMVMVASADAKLLFFRWDVERKVDSSKKLVIAINGKTPGPIVQAQRGDTIVVKVTNSLVQDNLAIRWDGLRQIGTPACGPVLAGGTCTYRFVADRVGAYSYESEYIMQKDAGLYGPIRVLP